MYVDEARKKIIQTKNNKSSKGSDEPMKRPHSAVTPCTNQRKNREMFVRPNSAGSLYRATWQTNIKAEGLGSAVSLYTNSSTKFLQSLLNSSESSFSNLSSTEFHISSKEYPTNEKRNLFKLVKKHNTDSFEAPSSQRNETDIGRRGSIEETLVKLSPSCNEKAVEKAVMFVDNYGFFKRNSDLKYPNEVPLFETCLTEKIYNNESDVKALEYKKEISKFDPAENKEFSEISYSKNHLRNPKHGEQKLVETTKKNWEGDFSQNLKTSRETPYSYEEINFNPWTPHLENSEEQVGKYMTSGLNCDSEAIGNCSSGSESLKEDKAQEKVSCDDSTIEEIFHLLQTFEEEDSESLNSNIKKDVEEAGFLDLKVESVDGLNEVYAFLEQVEKDEESSEMIPDGGGNCYKTSSETFQSPRLEDLLGKSPVELAHEVLSLKLQIEEQKKGIKLLRESLAEIKEERKEKELEYQEALHKSNAEAEILVQRHQKFIKQLLSEKKNLNETVSKLVQELKTSEERYKKNMKAIEEKYVIEIKKAKEAQAVSEKIKREKWMEIKTKKIKEMTIKGLEPELSRMAIRQQEEMTELRNLHREELEAVELRAARRSAELMDHLRAEMTKEKEAAIARETSTLRARLEKDFESERIKMQNQLQVLKDRIRREEQKLTQREIEFQEKIAECKKEAEKEQQRLHNYHREELEEVRRKQLIEVKNLKESLEGEKEIWANNFKKQQAALIFEKEKEIQDQCKRERDRDIEKIIEAFEKESTKAQEELTSAAENKLKRFKEKFESEIQEMEANEAAVKTKLSEAKALLLEKEDTIAELGSRVRQCLTEIAFLQKSCEEMTCERGNLKEIIRKEFEIKLEEAEKEKTNLYKELTLLKESHEKELGEKEQQVLEAKKEMQRELVRVHARVKTAVNKKEEIIENLKEEIKASNQRCQQLEFLLDRQRKNLLL